MFSEYKPYEKFLYYMPKVNSVISQRIILKELFSVTRIQYKHAAIHKYATQLNDFSLPSVLTKKKKI